MTILVHKSDTINGHEFAYAVRTTSDGIDIELISGVTSLEFADEAFEYIKQLDVCAGYENVTTTTNTYAMLSSMITFLVSAQQ